MSVADDVLHELMMEKTREPMSRADACELADQWYALAVDNGLSAGELDKAAGMDLAEYIIRTFGEAGQEVVI